MQPRQVFTTASGGLVAGAALALALALAGCSLDHDDHPPPPPDAPIDAPTFVPDAASFCTTCGPGTICVQVFNGTCGALSLECQPLHAGCAGPVCSTECQRWHCNAGNEMPFFFCNMATCPFEESGALHCYGP